MAVSKVSISSCLSILATFLLLSTATATARKHVATAAAVSPFCTNATVAPDDKVICTQLVDGAKTWPEAMTNAIKGVIRIANVAKPTVVDRVLARLPTEMDPAEKEQTEKDCQEGYDYYMYHLDLALKCVPTINNEDCSHFMKTYLSPMYYLCKDSLEESQVSLPEVTQYYDQTNKLANILFAVLEKKPKN